MSKARTLANLISDNAELADGQISVAEVVGAAPLASPTFTGVVGATTISSPTLNATINLKTTDANGEGIGLGIDADKKVRFYDDQGASTKMYWNASTATQKFEDSSKIAFGSSEDLKIYHSQTTGNNIDLSSNPLQIKQLGANSVAQFHKNSTGHGPLLQFYNNGASHGAISTDNNQFILSADGELLVRSGGGSLKLATTSTGIDVTGTVSSDGLSVDGTITADNFTNVDLTAIAKDISDTAVDVFVYDTSKDSDGGAWRKRTQGTSWYNETLNTATRGSRKEFPAVAVIVAESNQVTIYDGDDPDLPMWMVFSSSLSQTHFPRGAIGKLTMLNGKFVNVGNPYGLDILDFISEDISYNNYATLYGNRGTVANRNGGLVLSRFTDDSKRIISNVGNDVAMTVLPNAPIDAATGLPVPTIAVATNGGVSVIKDDGTVVDITTTSGASAWSKSNFVAFRSDNKIVSTVGYSSNDYSDRYVHINTIPSADFSVGNGLDNATSEGYHGATGGNPAIVSVFGEGNGRDITSMTAEHFGQASGLSQVAYAPSDTAPDLTSMVAYTTSDYNTGWMNGDIKLATLSDTDTTNVTGSELVTNGTFASNVTGWTTAGGSSVSHQSGQAKVTATSSNILLTQQLSGLVVGQKYTFSATITPFIGASGAYWGAYLSSSYSNNIGNFNVTDQVATKVSATFTATATNNYISLGGSSGAITNGEYLLVDNFSVRLAEEDRSANGNGLQVFGTVTKSAVATGTDLVAYSGFGNGNYLKQPYNSDLDFGTGTFSITTWAKIPAINSFSPTLVDRHVLNQARILLYAETGNQLPRIYIAHTNGSTSTYVTGPTAIDDGQWHCWHANRRGNGQLELWIDGVKVAYGGVGVDSISVNTNGPTIIGNDYTGGGTGYMNGDMALTRISATAPSPEQIDKIYNDEKHLFQDGAQATLYGTSDAVTALAHDDTTDLLHVGTSAGRSVFQGLRRVDNTTTAVGAAISASNGLVAED
jgi:hypothetical protein